MLKGGGGVGGRDHDARDTGRIEEGHPTAASRHGFPCPCPLFGIGPVWTPSSCTPSPLPPSHSRATAASQPELECLLYPVLVHVALSLVEQGAAREAHALLALHGPRFGLSPGRAAQRRARELQSLQMLTGREQLAGNAVAAAWRARRPPLRLSAYSHGLLLRALQTPALQLILGVVNGHLRLEVAEGPPATAAELAAAEELGSGQGGDEDGAVHNRQPIDLQLLQVRGEGVLGGGGVQSG